jgi:LPS-assembly lipoprotein
MKHLSGIKFAIYSVCIILFATALTGCGFHLQGNKILAPPLQTMYLDTPDPYGTLAQNLEQNLKLSNVKLVSNAKEAKTVLVIIEDNNVQELLSVSGTQQTRQYALKVFVTFAVTDSSGRIVMPATTLIEQRYLTIQSNQILGTSNESNLFYQQMRRTIAYNIMNRLASHEVTSMINKAIPSH